MINKSERELVVSFTTYPSRFFCLPKILESMFKQTRKADRIVLYLTNEEVPEGVSALPDSVQALLLQNKFEVRFVEKNLKPHNKYFYAFRDFPEALVVTIDDDLVYPPYLLECLYNSYIKHSDCVIAARTHTISYDFIRGGVLPYRYWIYEDSTHVDTPSHLLFATGVGGVLYPVHLFGNDFLDMNLIEKISMNNDDIYLKMVELVKNIPVVLPQEFYGLSFLPDSQNTGLCWSNNGSENKNDVWLKNCFDYAKERLGRDLFKEKLLCESQIWNSPESLFQRINELNNGFVEPLKKQVLELSFQADSLKSQLNNVKKSRTYKVGRLVTFIPRKIKEFLR